MPSGELYDRLTRVIFELSRKHGAPVFEPHVTLLANIPGAEDTTVALCQRLAAMVEPFSIQLTKLDHLNEYYRCLFARVLETRSVVETHSKARNVFGLQQELLYMPHLSLLYGHFDEATKQEIIEGLRGSWDLEFPVDRFDLIDGRGGPANWRKLGEFAFQSVSHRRTATQ